jgi:hypothetical protein
MSHMSATTVCEGSSGNGNKPGLDSTVLFCERSLASVERVGVVNTNQEVGLGA